MPGYTHLQRAQPVYLVAPPARVLLDVPRATASGSQLVLGGDGELPLGAGALAGVNFDTDRAAVARELGFDGVAPNSLDAVSNRDFVLDYLARRGDLRDAPVAARRRARAVVQRGVRLLRARRRVRSGSSIMPQKKNPDAAELLRAKAPRVAATSPRCSA